MRKKILNKKTKQKIGLSLIGLMPVLPIAIALNQSTKENHAINFNASTATTNDGYLLDVSGYANLATSKNLGNVFAFTPGSYTSVPNGYVFTVGDYNHDQVIDSNTQWSFQNIVCVDKNNPSKILWSTWIYSGVVQIEYLPASDQLVVFSNDSTIYLYNNISQNKDNVSIAPNSKIYVNSYINKGYDTRYPLFRKITPIYEPNKPVTKFLIYSQFQLKGYQGYAYNHHYTYYQRAQYNGGAYKGQVPYVNLIYDTKNNTITKRPNLNIKNSTNEPILIHSIGAIEINGVLHLSLMINRSNRTQLEYLTQTSSGCWNKGVLNIFGSADTNIFQQKNYNIIRGAISVPGIRYNKDSGTVSFIYANNIHTVWGSIHNNPFMAGHVIDTKKETHIKWSANIFGDEKNTSGNSQLWGGYFDNTLPKKYGANSLNNIGTPFISIGKYNGRSSFNAYGNKPFVSVIQNPAAKREWNAVASSSKLQSNYSYHRIYAYGNDSNYASNSKFYFGIGNSSADEMGNYLAAGVDSAGWSTQNMGIPIKAYNDDINSLKNPFTDDILLTANGSNKAVIINQSTRVFNGASTYGWVTRITNEREIKIDSLELSNDINEAKSQVLKKLAIEAIFWNNSSFIRDFIKPKNIRKNVRFTINDFKLIGKNTTQFDLYITSLYLKDGRLNHTTFDSLKKNWWPNHKLGTFTIIGKSDNGDNNGNNGDNNEVVTTSTYFDSKEISTLNNTLASKVALNQNAIIKIINENQLIKDAASTIDFQNDIEIVTANSDDTKGVLSLVIKLKNSKGQVEGKIKDVLELNGFISGFEKEVVQVLETKVNPSVILDELNKYSINEYYVDEKDNNKVFELILRNKEKIFIDLPSGWDGTLTIKTITKLSEELLVKFEITKFYDSLGNLNTKDKKEFSVSISGFMKNVTTHILGTRLNGVSEILPSKALNSANLEIIKKAIIEKIINTNGIVETNDIVLNVVEAQDNEGSLIVDVTIKNNKAKINGVVKESYTIPNIQFEGFKISNIRTSSSQGSLNYLSFPFIIIGLIILVFVISIVVSKIS